MLQRGRSSDAAEPSSTSSKSPQTELVATSRNSFETVETSPSSVCFKKYVRIRRYIDIWYHTNIHASFYIIINDCIWLVTSFVTTRLVSWHWEWEPCCHDITMTSYLLFVAYNASDANRTNNMLWRNAVLLPPGDCCHVALRELHSVCMLFSGESRLK